MNMLACLVTCLLAAVSFTSTGKFPDISVTELKKAMTEQRVILIDMNGSVAFAKGHIPTAIDYVASKDKMEQLLDNQDRDTLVVAYCGGPSCNAYKKGASKAKELGFTNIKHLSAGISGWMQAGEQTEKLKEAKKG